MKTSLPWQNINPLVDHKTQLVQKHFQQTGSANLATLVFNNDTATLSEVFNTPGAIRINY